MRASVWPNHSCNVRSDASPEASDGGRQRVPQPVQANGPNVGATGGMVVNLAVVGGRGQPAALAYLSANGTVLRRFDTNQYPRMRKLPPGAYGFTTGS